MYNLLIQISYIYTPQINFPVDTLRLDIITSSTYQASNFSSHLNDKVLEVCLISKTSVGISGRRWSNYGVTTYYCLLMFATLQLRSTYFQLYTTLWRQTR